MSCVHGQREEGATAAAPPALGTNATPPSAPPSIKVTGFVCPCAERKGQAPHIATKTCRAAIETPILSMTIISVDNNNNMGVVNFS